MQQMIQKLNLMRLLMGIMLMGTLAWGCGGGEAPAEEPAQETVAPEPAPEPEPAPIEVNPEDTTKKDTSAEQRPINRN